MESLHNTASLKKFEFLRQFRKALRKLDHVLLWILSTNTGLWQCRVKKILMTSNVLLLHTLPLARPTQAKVQMLTTSSCIVKSIPWNLVNLSHLYQNRIFFYKLESYKNRCFQHVLFDFTYLTWNFIILVTLWGNRKKKKKTRAASERG